MSVLAVVSLILASALLGGYATSYYWKNLFFKMLNTNDNLIKLFDEQGKLLNQWKDTAIRADKEAEYYHAIGITLSQRLMQVDPSFKQQAEIIKAKGTVN
jgi:hypothetical protein